MGMVPPGSSICWGSGSSSGAASMMEMFRDLSFSQGRWGGVEGWLGGAAAGTEVCPAQCLPLTTGGPEGLGPDVRVKPKGWGHGRDGGREWVRNRVCPAHRPAAGSFRTQRRQDNAE